ncbi:hypothetical protein K461DRAFT_324239 [Myriangium duriaei CBS 260.36]|uniref:SWR1-complex protein 3 domain-containing protein n=1 Tax=Myriangium duriaei CBS 260.36 TaxID=1168546 RepID=A0A9P4IUN7_9PEZI|nr:hypothetical protein K461DRAFT_324239 [Myriangium duriaei CBS 260.36]
MKDTRQSGRNKAGQPPAKKTRLSSQVKLEESPKESTPAPTIKSEAQESKEDETPQPTLLPDRIYRSRPLPTLPELQATTLPEDEYQSIESSGTLLASLERSRQKWLAGEFFERYWTKTSGSKKDQKNALSSNPPKTWMKDVGRCTIIVEPLIFEANVYISKDPAIVASTQQQNSLIQQQQKLQQQQSYNSSNHYGAQYRPNMGQQNSSNYQAQPRPFAGVAANASKTHYQTTTPSAPPATPAKQTPDPVIQLLASRASTDRDLKELMKIVATGTASPEQLRAFQKHIDELNAVVAAQNAAQAAESQQQSQPQPQQAPPQARTTGPAPQPLVQPIQQRPVAQAPVKKELIKPPFPVVLEFLDPGASSDRFLFPPYSIVESLGSFSVLASFMIFRKGSEASASVLFDADTEYYEPVTVKIDVVPGTRSVEVLDHMKRSVKPADEVRKWMEEQIRTKRRADQRYLPLKLPCQSQLPPEEEIVEETPPPAEAKKRGPYKKKADREREQQEKEQQEKEQQTPAQPEGNKKEDKKEDKKENPVMVPEVAAPTDAADSSTEGHRRSMKRSTRLGDVMAF